MADIHWINGRTCQRCGKALGDNFRGRRCYNCMAREHAFDIGISCMTYGLKERQMILDYKYNGKSYMGRKFGDMMADRLAAWDGEKGDLDADVIVPVPIHPSREKKRGFNQAGIMADRLSSLTGIPVRHRACKRVKHTKLLRSMSPIEREAALDGAFEVPEKERPYVDGMRVLLVDDIMTTGATADSCAKALKHAGAASVNVITLASGANRKPSELCREDMQSH